MQTVGLASWAPPGGGRVHLSAASAVFKAAPFVFEATGSPHLIDRKEASMDLQATVLQSTEAPTTSRQLCPRQSPHYIALIY